MNVIEEDPDSLIRVPGIGKVRVERIKKSWVEQKEIKNIMLFLQSHTVSTSHATKIWKTYNLLDCRYKKLLRVSLLGASLFCSKQGEKWSVGVFVGVKGSRRKLFLDKSGNI